MGRTVIIEILLFKYAASKIWTVGNNRVRAGSLSFLVVFCTKRNFAHFSAIHRWIFIFPRCTLLENSRLHNALQNPLALPMSVQGPQSEDSLLAYMSNGTLLFFSSDSFRNSLSFSSLETPLSFIALWHSRNFPAKQACDEQFLTSFAIFSP